MSWFSLSVRLYSALPLFAHCLIALIAIIWPGSIPVYAAPEAEDLPNAPDALYSIYGVAVDDERIVFTSERDGNWEIYTMNPDGTDQTRLTNNTYIDDQPLWSPDHSKIAFASLRDLDWEIYVMNADGSDQTRITNVPGTDFLASWSPDGSKFVFSSSRDGITLEIYTMNVDGSNPQRLTDDEFTDEQPIWSPDGSKILFISNRDGNDNEVYVMDADGSNITQLTFTDAAETRALWSPNGSKIVFSSARDGNYEIYIMNADGSQQLRVTNVAGDDVRATWNADGSKLVFDSNRSGNYEVYMMDANGTNVVNLSKNGSRDFNPDWYPLQTLPPAPEVCGGVFIATSDSYVDQAHTTSVNGTDNDLRIAKATNAQNAALLTFDLSSLPPGTFVKQAVIELLLDEAPSAAPYSIAVMDVGAYDENTVTWANQPPAGMEYGEKVYSNVSGVVQIDITDLATRWLNGEVSPTSVRLLPGTGADFSAKFVSREGADLIEENPRLLIQCGPPVTQMPSPPVVLPSEQAAALAKLEIESTVPISYYLHDGLISIASFKVVAPTDGISGTIEQAQWFLNEYSDLFGVESGEVFQMIREADNGTTVFFRQRDDGIPILAAEIAVHTENGAIIGFNGNYVTEINLPTLPELTAQRAEEVALTHSIGDGITGDTQLRYVEMTLLGVMTDTTHLTWAVNAMRSSDKAKIETLYIDAFTGALVFREPADAHGFDLDLENGRGALSTDLCDIWDDADIDWNDLLPDSETATNNNRAVYNFWRHNLGRDSYDHDGEQIEVNINVSFAGGVLNAAYTGCDIFVYSPGTTTLDITGHEFTHAVIANEAELIYKNQSGALNESFADIFGYFAEPSSFQIGDGSPLAANPVAGRSPCPTTMALRDLMFPSCYGQPDHMVNTISGDGRGYWNTTQDDGGVHNNSGIHNKAAALIIAGGTFNNYTLSFGGLGRFKAMWLFNNMLNNRLTEGSQFIDARNAAIAEAIDLANKGAYGFVQADVCVVRKAYAAVGIGFADRDCDGVDDAFQPDLDVDKDGIRDAVDLCPHNFNPGQANLDGDALGDSCDPDIDGDGRNNPQDNCPWVSNAGWADWNNNGAGDACDDSDTDGVVDNADNCRDVENPGQENMDLDRFGDACDPDWDNDLWTNELDNCPVNYNPGQQDTTEIALGLAADKVGDICDLCPAVSGADNRDPDKDGLGNACDDNDDNDAWLDGADNCPNDFQYDQLDWDKNGIGYTCDAVERTQFGLVIKRYNDQFVEVDTDFKIPVPICPECGLSYVPIDWRTTIDLVLPVNFKASVINSTGAVVSRSNIGAANQVLNFRPAQFAVSRFAVGLSASVDPQASIAPQAMLDRNDINVTEAMLEAEAKMQAIESADNFNYYVHIYLDPAIENPEPGYSLDFGVEEAVVESVPTPINLYFPMLAK